VEDDGVGLKPADDEGMGLKGMRERLAALGGTLSLANRNGGGARVAALIPRQAEAVEAAVA
jgi:signal transduction histidine kinase